MNVSLLSSKTHLSFTRHNLTEYESEHFWENYVIDCNKLFRFSCLITKTFRGYANISLLKKMKSLIWRVDYSGLVIRIILFEWAKQFIKIFFLLMTRKCGAFLTKQNICDTLATSVIRDWVYSKLSRLFHSSLIFMLICLYFINLAKRCPSVTLCVVIGGFALPLSTSQPNG